MSKHGKGITNDPLAWRGRQTDVGGGMKRVQVENESGELIYDITVDSDTVFTGPVQWEDRQCQ